VANKYSFTAQVTVPNLREIKIGRVMELDEDAKRMVVEINVEGAGNVRQRREPWRLEILNGSTDALVAPPTPAFLEDVLVVTRLTGAGVATAFDTALAAYRSAGGDKRGNLLTALGGITGTIADPRWPANTTAPILPAGSLT
jgi:hypothetical protein